MKSKKEIKNYIEAIKKRYEVDVETKKIIDILEWILEDEVLR